MSKILVIDDDSRLFSLLEREPTGWDGVILDVMLPEMSGYAVLQRLRTHPGLSRLPVLMLTARGQEEDKIAGLELGADDYLAKPFSAKELLARLRALLRRTGAGSGEPAVPPPLPAAGGIVIDRAAMTLRAGGGPVQVSAAEIRLVDLLARTPGKPVSRELLCRAVFGHRPMPMDRSLDMMISRLRKKLGPPSGGGERIRAVRGEGYALLCTEDEE